MTRKDREEMKRLSIDVYGNAGTYAKMMRKGEYRPLNTLTSTGKPITVKRWYPITAEDVRGRMVQALVDREVAKAKILEEKNKQGGTDVSQEKNPGAQESAEAQK